MHHGLNCSSPFQNVKAPHANHFATKNPTIIRKGPLSVNLTSKWRHETHARVRRTSRWITFFFPHASRKSLKTPGWTHWCQESRFGQRGHPIPRIRYTATDVRPPAQFLIIFFIPLASLLSIMYYCELDQGAQRQKRRDLCHHPNHYWDLDRGSRLSNDSS